MRRWFTFATFAGAVTLLALPACTPSVPDAPTYKADVQPIMLARCVRCHGSYDGTMNSLNGDPAAKNTTSATPAICFFQHYDDAGDCSGTAASCQRGAHYCATLMGPFINADDSSKQRMPPLPADRLNDWESQVLNRWIANPLP